MRRNAISLGLVLSLCLGGSAVAQTGACCQEETCTIETHEDCFVAGGIYLGDGTDCTLDPCPFCCGDINDSWPGGDCEVGIDIDGIDLSDLIGHLFISLEPLQFRWRADIDGVPGVTGSDLTRMVEALFITLQNLDCATVPGATFPESDDTLFIVNTVVPPGETTWTVEIWLKTSTDYYLFTFPFEYSSSVLPVTLSSIDGDHLPINTDLSRALVHSQEGPQGLHKIADLHFSLTASAASQTITVLPAEYPPTEHQLVIARFGDPSYGVRPVIFQEDVGACCFDDACALATHEDCFNAGGEFLGVGVSCEDNPCPFGCCGDLDNGGGEPPYCSDGIDLSMLEGHLFVTLEPLDFRWRADVDGVPGVSCGDYTRLVDFNFVSLAELDCAVIPNATYPESEDILRIDNVVVPPLTEEWVVEIWLDAVDDYYLFSFPFRYSSTLEPVVLTSIEHATYLPINTDLSRGMIFDQGGESGLHKVAELHFEVPLLDEPQAINVEPADYPPTEHTLVIGRFNGGMGTPSTGVRPKLEVGCCLPPSVGDLDQTLEALPENVNGIDLAYMLDGLFISLDWTGVCLDEADIDFTCGRPCIDEDEVNGIDLAYMLDALFISLDTLPKCDGSPNP